MFPVRWGTMFQNVWFKMEKHIYKKGSSHNILMAHTHLSRSLAERKPEVAFLRFMRSGAVETIQGAGNGNDPISPALLEKLQVARRHFASLGAERVYSHSLCVMRAAIVGKLLNPQANENDMLSMELADQILYHSLASESYLPTGVGFSPRFEETFHLQRKLSDLDTRPGTRCTEYVELLNDSSIDLTSLLVAFRTRIADSMTTHSAETEMASTTKMPGIFPVHEDWEEARRNMAVPMLKVYCPIADWGGNTLAYRQMRDNAIAYTNPHRFRKVARMVMQKMGALANSQRYMEALLQGMSQRLGFDIIVAPDYTAVSRISHLVGPDTLLAALKPFKGVGGLTNKSIKRDLPAELIHDWAGFTVITANVRQMYLAASYIYEEGMRRAAALVGVRDLHVCQPVDYATNPKPVTNYQSVHTDAVSSGNMMPTEAITRTLEMHQAADEGEANHDRYVESPLQNGERKRFLERKQEITESAA